MKTGDMVKLPFEDRSPGTTGRIGWEIEDRDTDSPQYSFSSHGLFAWDDVGLIVEARTWTTDEPWYQVKHSGGIHWFPGEQLEPA